MALIPQIHLGFPALRFPGDRHLGAGICLDRIGMGVKSPAPSLLLLHDTCCQQAHLSFGPSPTPATIRRSANWKMSQFILFLCLIGFWLNGKFREGSGMAKGRRLGTMHDNFLNLRALMSRISSHFPPQRQREKAKLFPFC